MSVLLDQVGLQITFPLNRITNNLPLHANVLMMIVVWIVSESSDRMSDISTHLLSSILIIGGIIIVDDRIKWNDKGFCNPWIFHITSWPRMTISWKSIVLVEYFHLNSARSTGGILFSISAKFFVVQRRHRDEYTSPIWRGVISFIFERSSYLLALLPCKWWSLLHPVSYVWW